MTANSVILAKRVSMQLLRDRRTFGMILVIPILITLIFGYAIGGNIENVPVAIIIEDHGTKLVGPENQTMTLNIGIYMKGFMQDDHRVKIIEKSSFSIAKDDVNNERLVGAILFPENFTFNVIASQINETGSTPEIDIFLDGTRPTLIQGIMASVQEALNRTISIFSTISGKTSGMPTFSQEFANNLESLDPLDVSIPGIIALILNFLVLLFSTLMLVRESTYQTKVRLLAAPIKPRDIILGYTLALMGIATLMSISVLSISIFIFNAKVVGNIFELFLCIELFGSSFVFLGVFLSNFARNELQAVQMAPMIAFPSMALSGFLVPVEILPESLQILSKFIPMTYGINLFRGIMLKGFTIIDLWFDFLVVVLIASVCLTLAMITIKGTTD